METLGVIALVLFALLLGFVVPVLLQLRATLKSAQDFIESTSPRVDAALRDVSELTVRVSAIASEVEGNLPRMRRLVAATDGVVDTLEGVQRSIKMVGAVAPAAFAAVKAAIGALHGARGGGNGAPNETELDNSTGRTP